MPAPAPRPLLLFAWGNPARGDDALGPALVDLFAARQGRGEFAGLELLTDYQLQVEHALDLAGRERVLFVDASVSATPPCELGRLRPERDTSYTTHAMSPAAVLAVYEQINGVPAPPAWLLSIRGYVFGLGRPLSERAGANLQAAFAVAREFLESTRKP